MKQLNIYIFLMTIFLLLSSWQIEKGGYDLNINVSEDGSIKINNFLITHQITNSTLDSLIGLPTRIKQKRKSMPHLYIYDSIGIRSASAPCEYKESLPLRCIDVFYQKPFNTAPKEKYNGKLEILGTQITEETRFSDLINKPEFKKHQIYYESDSAFFYAPIPFSTESAKNIPDFPV